MHWLLATSWMLSASGIQLPTANQHEQAKGWLLEMKANPRGPYQGVAWFCNDGQVLPPRSYACVDFGGGMQYAVHTPQAKRLAALGVYVGTILAPLKEEVFFDNHFERARALLVERYLERALDGWVLKSAKAYRGFRQVEDEEAASARLLLEFAKRPEFLGKERLLMLRLLRALPYGEGGSLADDIRAMAGVIGDADRDFGELRFKIHAYPEAEDTHAVAAYLHQAQAANKPADLLSQAEELLAAMRTYYSPEQRTKALSTLQKSLAKTATASLLALFLDTPETDLRRRLQLGTAVLGAAAQQLKPWSSAQLAAQRAAQQAAASSGEPFTPSFDRVCRQNLALLHVMSLVEESWIGAVAQIRSQPLTRVQALEYATLLSQAAEHLGLLSARERQVAEQAVEHMSMGTAKALTDGADDLSRALEWARAQVLVTLGTPLLRYEILEHRARGVVDDILRSGVTLPLAAVLDRIMADAERLMGGGHRLLGLKTQGAFVRGENVGIAAGPLRIMRGGDDLNTLQRHEIALLHDLPPELPPVAGILTVGSGGSLSHVSLLARNLGIPHAAISGELAAQLALWKQKTIALGVSSQRRVLLGLLAELPKTEQKVLETNKKAAQTFRIDADAIDLETRAIAMLDDVGPQDSGVRLGPKAAELGRLRKLFPERVSNAAVIPFGAFVAHVHRPGAKGAPSPLDTLRQAYGRAAELKKTDPEAADREVLTAMGAFREAIAKLPFVPGFIKEVDQALAKLGKPNTFGVFVRSDTNVEDLKDFTGAGLNLTVPNRVGRNAILQSLRQVWASPYAERSYRWRQQLLENPEYVFPSVILHKTVAGDVSGVMVTMDLESGAQEGVTISASEGVAGVVDGGVAETLVVHPSGAVQLLASARALVRRVIPRPPRHGVQLLAAQGKDPLLSPEQIHELHALAHEATERMPQTAVPWDIEFALVGNKAYLLQIRPLKIATAAATHPLLKALDDGLRLPEGMLDMLATLP